METPDAFISINLNVVLADVEISIVSSVPVYVDEIAAKLNAVELSTTVFVTPSLAQAAP